MMRASSRIFQWSGAPRFMRASPSRHARTHLGLCDSLWFLVLRVAEGRELVEDEEKTCPRPHPAIQLSGDQPDHLNVRQETNNFKIIFDNFFMAQTGKAAS